ncbi:hypothetical protein [Marinicrinis lubricantis]|uniref:hypothetical protein n=1 Tax=Marinicrinis lubricantis TaxID=2086470 RepID=UPI0036D21A9D
MRLADMLVYSDIGQLHQIANSYQCQCKTHSKNELIQAILSAFSRRERFEQMVQELELEDLRFINSLMFDKKQAFSIEELTAKASQAAFEKREQMPSPRERISKLKKYGWLFNGYSMQTRYLFSIPEDIKKSFGDVLKRHFMQHIQALDEPPVYREEQQLLQEDVLKFLQYVRHEPIQLSVDGFIYKKQLNSILEKMSVEESPVAKGEWRFGYGRRVKEYPNRFSFIYDYCFYNGLIAEEQQLTLTEKGERTVLDVAYPSPMELYRFYLKLYKSPIKNLEALVHWTCMLTERWVTFDSLRAALLPYVKPFYYDTSENIIEKRLVHMLMHLGLLKIGEHPEAGIVLRQSASAAKIIQGHFIEEKEVIVIDH